MIRTILAVAAAFALASCGSIATAPPTSPGAIAATTTADEQAMLSAERAYKLARTLSEVAVDAGVIKGEGLSRLRLLDARLYGALTSARLAYRAANRSSFLAATGDVAQLADDIRQLIGGRP